MKTTYVNKNNTNEQVLKNANDKIAIWINCFADLAVVAPVDVWDTFEEDPEKLRWYPPGTRPTECLQESVDRCTFIKYIKSRSFPAPS